jgi:D-beta-D-heptose 7-phosphate kinase/D-beta-D-heptose 1-phosphate adenosyltransferase
VDSGATRRGERDGKEEALARYERWLAAFPHQRIAVIGDVMLDCYIRGTVSRISPEAPVPVVEVQQTYYAPGGAANVALNIAHLGGRVLLLGVVGDDEEGRRLRQVFADNSVDTGGLVVDPSRPTTLKTRIIAHHQQIVRVDRESREPIGEEVQQRLLEHLRAALEEIRAVVVSDYAKGLTVPSFLREVIRCVRERGKPVVVDPKGHDYRKYLGCTVVTPNQREAAEVLGEPIHGEAGLRRAAEYLLRLVESEAVLITRGEEGMSLFEEDGTVTHVPAVAREVYDVTGAGDTVVSVLTLALAVGAPLVDSAHLANCAAGVVVGKLGTATVSPEELRTALRQHLILPSAP